MVRIQILISALLILVALLFSKKTLAQERIDFQNGHVIKLSDGYKYPRYARSEFPDDIVVSKLLNGTLDKPISNGSLGINQKGENLLWEAISAEEDGYFHSDKFNYGGLYVEYNSPTDRIMVLDAAGHSKVYVNGIPREGDHFDFQITKIPVQVKKGINSFYFVGGRKAKIRAVLYEPQSSIMLSLDHITLPDLIHEETADKWGAIMVLNTLDKAATEYILESIVDGTKILKTDVPRIEKLTVRRTPFKISELLNEEQPEVEVQLNLLTKSGKKMSSVKFKIKNKTFSAKHDRTFFSDIDGSVQYYSVTPGEIPKDTTPALIFSAHGAGVQARGQAGVYSQKDWAHIIAPTNRGPFGFAWEDWGRLDAIEVLNIGKELFRPDPKKVYLTGHSMGGHASWYLGATYPDYWAAIAPCAGYPELYGWIKHNRKTESSIQKMFERASNPQRTKMLARNYLHYGVYII